MLELARLVDVKAIPVVLRKTPSWHELLAQKADELVDDVKKLSQTTLLKNRRKLNSKHSLTRVGGVYALRDVFLRRHVFAELASHDRPQATQV
jgi:hypothetical protein